MKQQMVYLVELSTIQGTGDFACPKCGLVLSPDDETEENYCILEPIVKANQLDALVIQCQNCQSSIRLTGFSLLAVADGCRN
ncbi:MAG: hypothetical protein CW716_00490 [Candidatus Bathyarchaeum sp.]|nr:MAG: hypothetical protein CW716_00490 [Candidatus Bathyarchaeum sp.]